MATDALTKGDVVKVVRQADNKELWVPINELKTGAVAVGATPDGAAAGQIPDNAIKVAVTSGNIDRKISLPPNPAIGDEITLYMSGTACELVSATAADKVNNVIVGATNELALVANATYKCEYRSANEWLVRGLDNLGADLAALVPNPF